MANIKFHRSKGMFFNGVLIENDCTCKDIYLLDVDRKATPVLRKYDYIVPNKNGSISFKNRYDDKYITVVIGLYSPCLTERRLQQRSLIDKFINGTGNINDNRLIFLDEESLFHKAEIFDEIGVNEAEVFTELTITFKCSYCLYQKNKDIVLENITLDTNKELWNYGNIEAETIFKIKANTNCNNINISNGIENFTLTNIVKNDEIIIDSEKMIVYKLDSQGKKINCMPQFMGKFIKVKKSKNNLKINGTDFNANITISYNHTFIC